MPELVPAYPTHVVVDGIDGYVFSNDGTGLMDREKAIRFARVRNAERKPHAKTYMVFKLVEETGFDPDSVWTPVTSEIYGDPVLRDVGQASNGHYSSWEQYRNDTSPEAWDDE